MTGRRAVASTVKRITVGIAGKAPVETLLESSMTAKDLAENQGLEIDNVRTIKASINGRTAFKEIKPTDVVNGYKTILFVPEVSGGK